MKPASINLVAAIATLVAMAVAALSMAGDEYWTEFAPGPAFMPYWIAGFGALIAGLLIVQSAREQSAPSDEADFSDLKPAGVVIALRCGLLLVLPWVGMLLGTTITVLVILIGLLRRRVGPSLVTATITALLVYGVFGLWLKVALPQGPWGF